MTRRILTIAVSMMFFLAGVYTAPVWGPRPVGAQSTYAPIVCPTSTAVSLAAGTTRVIQAQNVNMRIVVCAFSFGSIAGNSFSIIEGTGANCGTNTLAIAGGTTAAAGYGIAANGSPVVVGGGVGGIFQTKVVGDDVCIAAAGTGPLAGFMTSEQQSY